MVIRISKVVKVFLSLFSVVLLIQNYLKSEFLMKQPKKRFMQHKPLKQRKKANQTARIVSLAMMLTRVKFGVLAKWTPTMSRPGVKAARL